mmetsp:Transcript_4925/g.7191  ORF Transcript_4925/g.7191 Transcript_4925/m.7191 type:complete len:156 (+) Transcript_4925:474-941(+)
MVNWPDRKLSRSALLLKLGVVVAELELAMHSSRNSTAFLADAADEHGRVSKCHLALRRCRSSFPAAFRCGSASLASSPLSSDLGSDLFEQLCHELHMSLLESHSSCLIINKWKELSTDGRTNIFPQANAVKLGITHSFSINAVRTQLGTQSHDIF